MTPDFGLRPVAPSRLLRISVAGLLPGVLAGVHYTGLLLFLNPAVALTWEASIAGSARFGALFGLISLVLHWVVPSLREAAARFRSLPWSLTGVFASVAAGAWVNASRFAYFLPPGVNDRLLKAAVWLSLAALAGFYTALLHSLHRRRYGRRSLTLFVALAIASVVAVLERREAFRPPIFNPPLLSNLSPERRLQVLVVALPSASMDLLLPLAEQGDVPFLASVLHTGSGGRLAALAPEREAALWASVATGKLPFRHGIGDDGIWEAGFLGADVRLRLLPEAGGLAVRGVAPRGPRPVDSRDLLAIPAWTALARIGLEVATVDMPLSSPPATEVGWVLGERFFRGGEVAQPASLDALARRFEPRQGGWAPDERAAIRSEELRSALSGDEWRRDLTRRLLSDHRDLDVVWLRLPGLAAATRSAFGGFAASRLEGSRGGHEKAAAAQLAGYAAQLDRLLSGLWEEMPRSERLLLVISPSGIAAPSWWQRLWGQLARRPAVEGRSGTAADGCLLMMGEGVRAGVEPRGARSVDLVPTLYYALGLPIPRDLDGRALTEVFEPAFLSTHPLTFVPSYETLPARRP